MIQVKLKRTTDNVTHFLIAFYKEHISSVQAFVGNPTFVHLFYVVYARFLCYKESSPFLQ